MQCPLKVPADCPYMTLSHPRVPVSPGRCGRPRPRGHRVADSLCGGGPPWCPHSAAPGQPRAAPPGASHIPIRCLGPHTMCPLCPHIPHPHVPHMSPVPSTSPQCSSISCSSLPPMFPYVPCPPVSLSSSISLTVPHPSMSPCLPVSPHPSVSPVPRCAPCPCISPCLPSVPRVHVPQYPPRLPVSHVSSCPHTPCPTATGQIPVPSLHVPTGPCGAVGDLWDGHHSLCTGIGGHHSSGAASGSGTSAGHGPERPRCVPMGQWHWPLSPWVAPGPLWPLLQIHTHSNPSILFFLKLFFIYFKFIPIQISLLHVRSSDSSLISFS